MDNERPPSQTIAGKAATDLVLCYVVCMKDAAGAFSGAIMLTDHRARPEHFAYVLPVKPTKLQRILYGSTLEDHVRIDVIGEKLLQQIPKKPDVIFVESSELIGMRRISNTPTALLAQREQSAPGNMVSLKFDTDANDEHIVGEIVVVLESTVNLIEPFNRIRQALEEIRKEKP